jgi:hypothetical protein
MSHRVTPHHVGLTFSDLAFELPGGPAARCRPSPEPGRRMAFVEDLDGNLVELVPPE